MFEMKDNKGQVSGLLGLIAVVGVGGIILMAIFNSTLTTLGAQSNNATLVSVQNVFIPLFILAGVAGAVIAVLLFSFGGQRR